MRATGKYVAPELVDKDSIVIIALTGHDVGNTWTTACVYEIADVMGADIVLRDGAAEVCPWTGVARSLERSNVRFSSINTDLPEVSTCSANDIRGPHVVYNLRSACIFMAAKSHDSIGVESLATQAETLCIELCEATPPGNAQ